MTQTDKVLLHKDGGIATITFNNPERHNAVSLDMWDTTARMLDEIVSDDALRVVIFTGAGKKAFVSGADISKFKDERATQQAVERYNIAVDRLYTSIHRFPKPTIAMIRGYCIGGGLGLATCCDIRICTEESRFALPAAKLSLGYSMNGIKRFVDAVGPAFTKEIFFTARQFSAAEAREMGLVNRVVADGELESYVHDYATTIAQNAPLTIKAAKYTVGELLEDASRRDAAGVAQRVQDCFGSADYEEGRRAFMEKRKPVFTGKVRGAP